MRRPLPLSAALACSALLHLTPLAAWFAFKWIAPPRAEKPLAFDDIGIIAMRQQEARAAAPPPPPEVPPAPKPPPPKPAPPRPAAVPLPKPVAAARPAPAKAQEEEAESRVAQRLADRDSLERAVRTQYLKEMKQQVERKLRYPLASRLAGETGKPGVRFIVALDGSIHSIVISRSSGHPGLDTAALDAIRRAAPFPPSPFGKDTEVDITLNFEEKRGEE
jgi:protein TonB